MFFLQREDRFSACIRALSATGLNPTARAANAPVSCRHVRQLRAECFELGRHFSRLVTKLREGRHRPCWVKGGQVG